MDIAVAEFIRYFFYREAGVGEKTACRFNAPPVPVCRGGYADFFTEYLSETFVTQMKSL